MPRCEILRRAASILEDPRTLGMMLKVSMSDLHDWLAGRSNPPTHVFLQAVDIIDAHAPANGRTTLRRALPE
jgi:hypothetical protein